jgi:hypothetical protein
MRSQWKRPNCANFTHLSFQTKASHTSPDQHSFHTTTGEFLAAKVSKRCTVLHLLGLVPLVLQHLPQLLVVVHQELEEVKEE